MSKPRKHAECIKAWADGASIQRKLRNNGGWCFEAYPGWYDDEEYRVEPPVLTYGNIAAEAYKNCATWEGIAEAVIAEYQRREGGLTRWVLRNSTSETGPNQETKDAMQEARDIVQARKFTGQG